MIAINFFMLPSTVFTLFWAPNYLCVNGHRLTTSNPRSYRHGRGLRHRYVAGVAPFCASVWITYIAPPSDDCFSPFRTCPLSHSAAGRLESPSVTLCLNFSVLSCPPSLLLSVGTIAPLPRAAFPFLTRDVHCV